MTAGWRAVLAVCGGVGEGQETRQGVFARRRAVRANATAALDMVLAQAPDLATF